MSITGVTTPGWSFADGTALLYLGVGLVVFVAIGALSHEHERAYSASILYLIIGVLAAALARALGLPWIGLTAHAALLERITSVALAIALFCTGLRIDRFPRFPTRAAALLLSVVMLGTVAVVALYGTQLMGLSLGAAIALGAMLAPTDPVLAGDLGVKPPLEEAGHEEGDAPFALTTEAGLNDGLIAPFVILGLLLAHHHSATSILTWALERLLYSCAVGLLLGAAVGYGLAAVAFALRERNLLAPELAGWAGIASALILFGLAEVASGYGFLAAFVGGIAFRRYERGHEYNRHVHDTAEIVQKWGELAAVLLAATMIDFERLGALPLASWLLVPVVLVLVRPALAHLALAATRLDRRERLYLGWFGVKGVASVYYVAAVLTARELHRGQQATVVWSTLATVFISILLHGITAASLRRKLLRA